MSRKHKKVIVLILWIFSNKQARVEAVRVKTLYLDVMDRISKQHFNNLSLTVTDGRM